MKDKDRETVLCYAESNMNVRETARRMFYHSETIRYRLRQVRKTTGLNPMNFFDLTKLVEMARGDESDP